MDEKIYKHYDPTAREKQEDTGLWFIFSQGNVLASIQADDIFLPQFQKAEVLQLNLADHGYMGCYDGKNCYWALAGQDFKMPEGFVFEVRRPLYGRIADDLFMVIGRAFQLMNFRRTTKYCGACGTNTNIAGDGASKCPACGHTQYPQIAPAAITAILRDDKMLLARNKNFQGRIHSLIAGFLEAGETFEDCVRRETMEEVGIRVKAIRYFGNQPWPYPNSLMVGFVAEYESGDIMADGEEIVEAAWFSRDNLPELPHHGSIARAIIEAWLEGSL